MGRNLLRYGWAVILALTMGGCNGLFGPDRTGEIMLSSQLFGTDTYYLFGYSYEYSELYKYPFQGDPVPDIINEGWLIIDGGEVSSLPGFNTPGQVNGFSLLGEFGSLEGARGFYEDYSEVEAGLQFETVSDTVELYQVWLQQTSEGNYVKLLVKDIQFYEVESGRMYNEVSLEYTYQRDGSSAFPN